MSTGDIVAIATLVITVVGAIVGHFVSIGGLKDKIHHLEIEQEKLKNRDELQQLIIEQLKEVFPMVKGLIENGNSGNNKKLK